MGVPRSGNDTNPLILICLYLLGDWPSVTVCVAEAVIKGPAGPARSTYSRVITVSCGELPKSGTQVTNCDKPRTLEMTGDLEPLLPAPPPV